MVKTLQRTGNSLALVIDKTLLQLLDVDPAAPAVSVRVNGRQLVVTAVDPADRAKFEAGKQAAYRQYGKAFKPLAE